MPKIHPNEPPEKSLEPEAQTTSAAPADEADGQRPASDDVVVVEERVEKN